MNTPGEDGTTLLQHLQAVEQQTGKTPKPLLEAPDLSPEASSIWGLFVDIASGREQSGMGFSPLSWQSIHAWCNLTGRQLSIWQLDVIKRLDRIWADNVAKGNK